MSPAAEEVVIGAAYRALMRHYHPDTNPDPTAQARARQITAAYAVLRDPVKRAEYDAQRADGDLWSSDDADDAPRKPPPAMRTVGIAAAVIALGLVAAAWQLADQKPPAQPAGDLQAAELQPAKPDAGPTYPVVQLEPESERLARLHEQAEILSPRPAPPPPEDTVPDPVVGSIRAQPAPAAPMRAAPAAPRRGVASAPTRAKASPAPKNERLAALDTMAAGFFAQSMAHATDAKKNLLVGARNRSAAKRKACGSDTCVADAYVRQIRETSAIMEGRSGPTQ